MKISVRPDNDRFSLWVEDGKMSGFPAGPRLFRGDPVPVIEFTHAPHEGALTDAVKLQKYLDELPAQKPKKK